MKRVFKYTLFVFLLLFLFIPKNADARVVCTSGEQNKMKNKAYQVTLNYEFYKDENGSPYFLIVITNLQEGLEVKVDDVIIKYAEGKEKYELERRYNSLTIVEAEIYAAYGAPCVGQKLYTKRITLPKYNYFSEMEECIEYEEFPLCNKWYQGKIENYSVFLEELEKYIESLKPKVEEPIIEEKSFFEKIIDFYIDNIIYTGPITAIIVFGGGFIIVRNIQKKKKRIKIEY